MLLVFFEQAGDFVKGIINRRVHAGARHPHCRPAELLEELWAILEDIISHDDIHRPEKQVDGEVVGQLVSKLGNELH